MSLSLPGDIPQDMGYPNSSRDWPFRYSEWHRIAEYFRLGYADADEEYLLRTFNDRCERREQKKATKLARAQELLQRGPKVPGAWID